MFGNYYAGQAEPLPAPRALLVLKASLWGRQAAATLCAAARAPTPPTRSTVHSRLVSEVCADVDRQQCLQKIGGISRVKALIKQNTNLFYRSADSLVCITLYKDLLPPATTAGGEYV